MAQFDCVQKFSRKLLGPKGTHLKLYVVVWTNHLNEVVTAVIAHALRQARRFFADDAKCKRYDQGHSLLSVASHLYYKISVHIRYRPIFLHTNRMAVVYVGA